MGYEINNSEVVTSNGGSEVGTAEKRERECACARVRHLAFHSGGSKQDVRLKTQAFASECASQ